VVLWGEKFQRPFSRFLQNGLPEQLEAVPLATRIAMYFQHDGAPSHYIRLVMQQLNNTFPNWWIGRGSTITCPPGSPDLTPLDFCLWSWMKSKVNKRKLDIRDELLDHIMDVIPAQRNVETHSDEQQIMSSHELQSTMMLMVEFSKMYYSR
jgi:hypothetical protein